jgi:hypothetical protein
MLSGYLNKVKHSRDGRWVCTRVLTYCAVCEGDEEMIISEIKEGFFDSTIRIAHHFSFFKNCLRKVPVPTK